jgi:hypothetical protein
VPCPAPPRHARGAAAPASARDESAGAAESRLRGQEGRGALTARSGGGAARQPNVWMQLGAMRFSCAVVRAPVKPSKTWLQVAPSPCRLSYLPTRLVRLVRGRDETCPVSTGKGGVWK